MTTWRKVTEVTVYDWQEPVLHEGRNWAIAIAVRDLLAQQMIPHLLDHTRVVNEFTKIQLYGPTHPSEREICVWVEGYHGINDRKIHRWTSHHDVHRGNDCCCDQCRAITRFRVEISQSVHVMTETNYLAATDGYKQFTKQFEYSLNDPNLMDNILMSCGGHAASRR